MVELVRLSLGTNPGYGRPTGLSIGLSVAFCADNCGFVLTKDDVGATLVVALLPVMMRKPGNHMGDHEGRPYSGQCHRTISNVSLSR
jgi:hypothetical protein